MMRSEYKTHKKEKPLFSRVVDVLTRRKFSRTILSMLAIALLIFSLAAVPAPASAQGFFSADSPFASIIGFFFGIGALSCEDISCSDFRIVQITDMHIGADATAITDLQAAHEEVKTEINQ